MQGCALCKSADDVIVRLLDPDKPSAETFSPAVNRSKFKRGHNLAKKMASGGGKNYDFGAFGPLNTNDLVKTRTPREIYGSRDASYVVLIMKIGRTVGTRSPAEKQN